MAYIGPEPNPGQNREVDDISSGFNGSTTAFTLQVNSQNVSPGSSNSIIVSLGGVVQNPGTDYTVAASTLTFTTAPASGLSFFGLVLGQQVDTADANFNDPVITGDLSIADKIVHTGDTNTAIRFPATDTITAETGGSERVRVDSSGNVGIGTTSPSNMLHLSGTDPIIQFTDTVGGDSFGLFASHTDYLGFYNFTDSRVDMAIDGSGNVGIGTTSPDGKLSVFTASAGTVTANADGDELVLENSGNVGLSLLTAGTGESTIFFGNPGTNGEKDAFIKYYHETHATTANRRNLVFAVSGSERMRIDNDGRLLIGTTDTTPYNNTGTDEGVALSGDSIQVARSGDIPFFINRLDDSGGTLAAFYRAGSQQGTISVSGSTVSYNGGHLSRWSQIKGLSTTDKTARPTIYQGTVMSNLDDLCVWDGEDNQQLNMTKVSDTEGDKDVAGVFYTWDDDDDTVVNDFYIAMTGDMVIRIAASTTVARGDLLISAGDGTAKPQADDIVRSSTIAKIISTNHTATYADGSKAYPCVLMAC